MRVAQKPLRRTQISRTLSVSAPVAGWNARDPIAEMKAADAVSLDNMFCTPYDVMVRYGYSNWATGISGTVNSLASYSPPSGAAKMFAIAGANVYDTSNFGVVGSPVVSGVNTDKWQYCNFGTPGGNFLVAVSGSDLPLVYNGAAWGAIGAAAFNTTPATVSSAGTLATVTMTVNHNLLTGMSVTLAGFTPAAYNGTYVITVTGATTFTYVFAGAGAVTTLGTVAPTANFSITGVDPHLLISVMAFKSRLWFIEQNSLRTWYLPTLSIGGAAQSLDFSSLFHRGGYLMAAGDWSLDAGYGMDDYAVFITSEGEVAVYKGTDPASPTTWALVGVFEVGAPIGRRCLQKYAGDLTMICKDGIAPLSKVLMSSRINTVEMLSDRIQHVLSTYTTQYAANFGWETVLFPQENMLIVNVPTGVNTAYQLVMNTISGAWSRFLNWNASCFVRHQDQLYFGGLGGISKAWDTQSDGGGNINFEAQQSFNYFGSSAQLKQVQMVRPIISVDGAVSVLLGVNVDFDTTSPTSIPTFTPVATATWDAATWDGAFWGGGLLVKRDWQTSFGMGYAFSAHMKGALMNQTLRWASTDYLVQEGGVV